MIFIDSNVLIDILAPDSPWATWAEEAIGAADSDDLVINHIVLAEISPRFETVDTMLGFLRSSGISILELGDATAFHAGKAHARYRAAGGERQAILADFLIGAHAQTLEATLVTRDRQRFTTYFPELTLITPET